MKIRVAAVSLTAIALCAVGIGCGDDEGSSAGSPTSSATSGTSSTTAATTGAASGGAGSGGSGSGGSGAAGGMSACDPDPSDPNEDLGGGADPEAGDFTMTEALAGLPAGTGPLRAIFTTELGVITCTLEPTLAPRSVANFVGLARGTRPWRDPSTNTWVKRRFYDGLLFHRVIDDFMMQGGDPLGTGFGGPGYQFDDEISTLLHEPGALSYANAGPNTQGSQFFITEVKTAGLDGDYSVFGYCEPLSVIESVTVTPTDAGDRPLTEVHMLTVEIARCAL